MMNSSKHLSQTGDIELDALLEGVFRRYGFDFRNYACASLKRRIGTCMRDERVSSIPGLQEKLLHDADCMERFLLQLSINVTSMFRDPPFYSVLRSKVVPILRTYPFIRIWHAGCSTGEEVYSMAILLEEEGLYKKSRIYATDMNEPVLERAKAGIFPIAKMQEYTTDYLKSGGQGAFSEYYTARYDSAVFRASLKKNIVFAQHNLVTDNSFNEFNIILCRNVMIYFNKLLQKRAHKLFYESLCNFGILGLGAKESLKFSPYEEKYDALDARSRLYRRVK
ncbi:MAG: protein-glutamate O-methyltransferase CheR [Alphaproteobacteria bacterium]|nr:protein-glutamate O-methyltransferase CheR [Alphaproteobacteria bacterium]